VFVIAIRSTIFTLLLCLQFLEFTIRSGCCFAEQDTTAALQIDKEIAISIENTRRFRKVSCDIVTVNGSSRLEVSIENDSFAVVMTPISNDGHYTTNAYVCNEDYGFWVSKKSADEPLRLNTVTDFTGSKKPREPIYSYGQKLSNLAEAGMLSLPNFCPLSYLRLSDPALGVQSISQLQDSSDLYVVDFKPNLLDVTDRFGNVHRLSELKRGRIVYSKKIGLLPVRGELHRQVKHNDGSVENIVDKLEWIFEEFEDSFRLASYSQYREGVPVESRLEMTNFVWQATLRPDEFRLARFGFDEPLIVNSNSRVPIWVWFVGIGISLVIFSSYVRTKRNKNVL
jgi:hypothetical protein